MNAPLRFEQQYPSAGPLIVAIADWYRTWRAGPAVSELGNCTVQDIERMAADVGLTIAELRKLESTAHEPSLLPRMLAALKLEPSELAKADPAALRDLQRRRALCDSQRRFPN